MKTISEVRRENLKALIDEAGSQVAFAQKIDRSASQVSQWLNASKDSKSGKPRSMNDATARWLEEACGKTTGWMDQDHHIPKETEKKPNLVELKRYAGSSIANSLAEEIIAASSSGSIPDDVLNTIRTLVRQLAAPRTTQQIPGLKDLPPDAD